MPRAWLATLLLTLPALARPATVRVADGTTKVRPDDPLPAATAAALSAARNEYEAFQVVVRNGGTTALTLRSYAWSRPLTGPGGAALPAAAVQVLAEVMYNVTMQSGPDGAPGPWPDALVPDVDDVVHQKRNAFTRWWSAPAGKSGVLYVEVLVPDDPALPAGDYTSQLQLAFSDGTAATVPVTLTVWDFRLPSTSTLPSVFGLSIDSVCRAMSGQTYCNGRVDQTNQVLPWARFLLDHRVTISAVQSGPDALGGTCNLWASPPTCDWAAWDRTYAPLIDGTDPALHLKGARMTTIQFNWGQGLYGFDDPAAVQERQAWAQHFRAKGWFDRTFDYTCDEPPAMCAWADIPRRAGIAHAADPAFRTLVTTNIQNASVVDPATGRTYGSFIDVITPNLNHMEDKAGLPTAGNQRPKYNGYYDPAAGPGPQRRLWMYQSCMEHGCGSGTNWDSYWTGWQADYTIDASGVKNRAMEWLSFIYQTQGELYWDTAFKLPTAFTDQSGFGGSGDGNLLYPGTPANIGGTTGIPVASLRLKLIRDGMEDYEYLNLVAQKDPAFAMSVAKGLFQSPSTYGAVRPSPAQLLAARAQLARRILELSGAAPAPTAPPAPGPALEARVQAGTVVDGALREWAAPAVALDPPAVGSDNTATARVAYDARYLYAAFSVGDASVVVNQGGRDGELWDGDSVELMIDAANDKAAALDPNHYHLLVNVNGDVTDERGTTAGTWDRSWTSNALTRVVRTAAGYDVEVAVPWSSLGVAPCTGARIGLDLAVNDVDQAGGTPRAVDWAQLTRFAQPSRWGTLTLGGRLVGDTYPLLAAPAGMAIDGNLAKYAGAPALDLGDRGAAAGSDDRPVVRLLWSPTALYAAFDVADAALLTAQGGADGEVWNGDGVELMLRTAAGATALGPTDFHVLANFRGEVTDERGAGGAWDRGWNLPLPRPVKAVVKASGGYVVELAIPWSAMGLAAPAAGATFGLDLANNDLDVAGGPLRQFDWAGLTRFAQPTLWLKARLDAAPACVAP